MLNAQNLVAVHLEPQTATPAKRGRDNITLVANPAPAGGAKQSFTLHDTCIRRNACNNVWSCVRPVDVELSGTQTRSAGLIIHYACRIPGSRAHKDLGGGVGLRTEVAHMHRPAEPDGPGKVGRVGTGQSMCKVCEW